MSRDVTYFFYGRPAYRPGKIGVTTTKLDSRPVCLMFRKGDLPPATNVYPFDTGALHDGRYAPYLDGVTFAELNCGSVIEAEGKIVRRYFSDNESYFFGREMAVLTPAATSNVAIAFHSLLRSDREIECDDRLLSIELLQDSEFAIKTTLRSVVLPIFLRADPDVSPILNEWKKAGIQIEPYQPQGHSSAGMEVERIFPQVGLIQGIETWPN